MEARARRGARAWRRIGAGESNGMRLDASGIDPSRHILDLFTK